MDSPRQSAKWIDSRKVVRKIKSLKKGNKGIAEDLFVIKWMQW